MDENEGKKQERGKRNGDFQKRERENIGEGEKEKSLKIPSLSFSKSYPKVTHNFICEI